MKDLRHRLEVGKRQQVCRDVPAAASFQMNQLAYGLPGARRQLGDIGRTKLYAAIKSGELKAIKVGRRTLITHQALQDYLDTRPCLQRAIQPRAVPNPAKSGLSMSNTLSLALADSVRGLLELARREISSITSGALRAHKVGRRTVLLHDDVVTYLHGLPVLAPATEWVDALGQ